MIDSSRITSAYEKAKLQLLSEQADGHWVGELSASSLATATAISALSLVRKAERARSPEQTTHPLDEFIDRGIDYLILQQNPDGGWGDTDKSYSNIAASMLVVAAIHLAGKAEQHAGAVSKAEEYIEAQGRIQGLRKRYGTDKTFVVPILTNCALAGLVKWNQVDALPFELACVPQSWYRFVGMPVVSYAIPALVAIGQAKHFHSPSWNPTLRTLRAMCVKPSLDVLGKMQPESGGYLEAVPLTAFVVMSLASTGRADHATTRRGVRFLCDSMRADGGWPIDTNLATWVTTLSLNALAGAGEDIARLGSLDWLLSCQHLQRHPFTGAEPGGWGWSDLSGAVPDADDTPGALLALLAWYRSPTCLPADRDRIRVAAEKGVRWLLNLQNWDGGWPTFCRGWGKLPFDRSGVDITAHALRAVISWQDLLRSKINPGRMERAVRRAFRYIERRQQTGGGWNPLWFGNQDESGETNLVYGTAKTLFAYRHVGALGKESPRRGIEFLRQAQNADGGWGGGPAVRAEGRKVDDLPVTSTIEETALAVEALLFAPHEDGVPQAVDRGLAWLCDAVENRSLLDSAPIGFYFAKLWYYERLYPLIFAVSTLGRAAKRCQDPISDGSQSGRRQSVEESRLGTRFH